MRVIIHRGTHEIGGSCVELQAGGTRILLDMGMPLQDRSGRPYGEIGGPRLRTVDQGVRDGLLPEVAGLYKGDEPGFDGVLLSHYHLDHTGIVKWAHPSIPVYCGRVCARLTRLMDTVDCSINSSPPWKPAVAPKEVTVGKRFEIGPFRITPFLNDHSAFEAFSFLVECGGKRLFYTGDLRKHGPIGAKTYAYLRQRLPRGIQALLLEGTMLSRPSRPRIATEAEVGAEMRRVIGQHKQGLVLCSLSASNVSRIVELYKATVSSRRLFVMDAYMAVIMETCKATARLPDFRWPTVRVLYLGGHAKIAGDAWGDWKLIGEMKYAKNRVTFEDMAREPGKYVLPFRPGLMPHLDKLPALLKGGLHLYSLWEGYRSQPPYAPVREFLDRHGIPTVTGVHVSGHAYVEDLRELADIVAPDAIVPIHTAHPEEYERQFPAHRIVRLRDGEPLDLAPAA